MDKTRVVLVKSVKVHPLYKKRFIVRKKYYAHDEQNTSKIGDTVTIREATPTSKLKRWVLVK
jgi:small subunit ribosomal protein S17